MKRILYVEDTVATQLVVRKHLSQAGEVVAACSLAEARLCFQKGRFDLMISDFYLPDGTSLELVQELRKQFSPEQLPVVVVSTAMDQLMRVRAFEVGVNDCFSMPTAWPVLMEAVERILKQSYRASAGVDAVAATWVEGKDEKGYWLFCPELKECLSGENLEALRAAMAQRVRRAVCERHTLPFVSRVQVSDHLVKLNEAPAGGGVKTTVPCLESRE